MGVVESNLVREGTEMRSATIAYYEYGGVLYHFRHDAAAGVWYFKATTPDLSRSYL